MLQTLDFFIRISLYLSFTQPLGGLCTLLNTETPVSDMCSRQTQEVLCQGHSVLHHHTEGEEWNGLDGLRQHYTAPHIIPTPKQVWFSYSLYISVFAYPSIQMCIEVNQ